VLIAGLLLVAFATSASAGELQWRKAGPKRFQPSADSQPISAQPKPVRGTAKIAQPAQPKVRRDGAVRQVAFEGEAPQELEGPSFGARQAGGTSLRSVVVDHGSSVEADESGAVRSAQLDFRPPTDGDNRYGEQMLEPFNEQPQPTQPEMKEESVEVEEDLPLPPETTPQEESTTPADTNRQPGVDQRQPPRTFEPAPSRNTPRPDPFVEADDEPNAGLPNTDDPTLSDEGADAQEDCAEELRKLKAHTLYDVNLSIAIAGDPGQDFPFECSIDDGTWHSGRCWNETTYMWKASALCHKPLYFENESLERYGHSWGPCLDPLVSGAHFFCTLPVLPYCMGVTPPNECMYALGHYRPGNCAPYMISPVPLSCRGAAFQAGAVVGAAAILP
jgi:hypothetical protein